MRRTFLSLLLALLLWGCSDQPAAPAAEEKSQPAAAPAAAPVPAPAISFRIIDSFDIGQSVFARSLFVDAEKNALWVGTSVGVHEIDLGTLKVRNTFTREQGLANEYVFAIGKDVEGYIWFGTNAGGATRYKDGDFMTFFPMHGLADYWIYSFASGPGDELWIGTWAGVNRLNLKSGEFTTYVKELVNEWVYAIEIDSQKRIWFGTEGGISMLAGDTWSQWTHQDGLGAANKDNLAPSVNTGLGTRRRHDLGILSGGMATYNPNYVFSLLITENDTIWAGTWGGGVGRFDGKAWQNFTMGDGLPGNIVYSLVRDNRGYIWAGTDNGLGVLRDGQWTHFTQNHLLRGMSIYNLAVSPQGEIWAGTQGKVIRIGANTQ